ncbi:hypothetical protein HOV93_24470 [Planctomycetes bacterium FF15]|uniref:Uncharacterized protein n=1 Tax=Bremerella alba TaxID=980252 RepID=A0A7V8V5C9_9BACT|nr:hypothetical protein [Bremerella alba]
MLDRLVLLKNTEESPPSFMHCSLIFGYSKRNPLNCKFALMGIGSVIFSIFTTPA